MTTPPISRHTPLAELYHRWPETVPAFMQRGMQCPACPFAPFHDIADAAREYGLDPDVFARALRETVERSAEAD
ncbi:DUF1858 domain-containing protein [Amaricoccus macauensis]|uniref:DUF1858 domain-containing protein n=1 Tax=Amaricoccus macauensis TaxID=57001 RepID=UPI003C7A3E52